MVPLTESSLRVLSHLPVWSHIPGPSHNLAPRSSRNMAYVPPGALALRSHLEANSPHHRLSSELIAYYKAEAVIGTQRVNLPHGANSKIPHQTSLFPQSPWLAKTCLIFLPHLQPLKSLNDLQQFSSHSKTIPSTQHTPVFRRQFRKRLL